MKTETKVFLPSPSSLGVTSEEVTEFGNQFAEENYLFNVGVPGEWNKLLRTSDGHKLDMAAAKITEAIAGKDETYSAIQVTAFVRGIAFALTNLVDRETPEPETQSETLPEEVELGC